MDQALWFASRGTGLVSLLLLTATIALGTVHTTRSASERWPRFTLHAVHRNLSTLSLVFLAVHIATAVIDPYVTLSWLDAVVPFVSAYKPLWVGLGAVAVDLMIAVVLTSAVRSRIPLRVWQWVHYGAYGVWPIAVVHGFGSGGRDSDLLWVQALYVLCAATVVVLVGRRIAARRRSDGGATQALRVPRRAARAQQKADAR